MKQSKQYLLQSRTRNGDRIPRSRSNEDRYDDGSLENWEYSVPLILVVLLVQYMA